MAKPKTNARVPNAGRYTWHFSKGTLIRARLDHIISEGVDIYPDTCEFPQMEKLIACLASGAPNPYIDIGIRGGKSISYRCTIKDDIFNAIDELYKKRDRGEYEKLKLSEVEESDEGSDYLKVEFTKYFVARQWHKGIVTNVTYKRGSIVLATHIKPQKGGLARIYLEKSKYLDKVINQAFTVE